MRFFIFFFLLGCQSEEKKYRSQEPASIQKIEGRFRWVKKNARHWPIDRRHLQSSEEEGHFVDIFRYDQEVPLMVEQKQTDEEFERRDYFFHHTELVLVVESQGMFTMEGERRVLEQMKYYFVKGIVYYAIDSDGVKFRRNLDTILEKENYFQQQGKSLQALSAAPQPPGGCVLWGCNSVSLEVCQQYGCIEQ